MNTLKLILISALLLTGASQAYAVPSQKLYSITTTELGSLKPSYQAVSTVPFDRSFSELSEREQNLVRKKFINLNLNDVPPYPVKGAGSLYRPILKAGSRHNEVGLLKLKASINAQGDVTKVEIESAPSPWLARKASKIVQRTKFEAGLCDGVQCEMQFPVELAFN